jgi:hypothetical protein
VKQDRENGLPMAAARTLTLGTTDHPAWEGARASPARGPRVRGERSERSARIWSIASGTVSRDRRLARSTSVDATTGRLRRRAAALSDLLEESARFRR